MNAISTEQGRNKITVDGNEAAASVAHRVSEVIAIYPITPSSNMGELADEWSSQNKKNLWGIVPDVVEMQSEAGAAGAVHGRTAGGALTTTFTAVPGTAPDDPQHVQDRRGADRVHDACRGADLATPRAFDLRRSLRRDGVPPDRVRHAVLGVGAGSSRFRGHRARGDARSCAFPFLHFFDGFRTSHEVAKIEELTDDDLRLLISEENVRAHRSGVDARPSRAAGHRSEPGCILSGA
jgi:pyruvate-ferredoxin/flavodoxin oxidoreductase